MIACHRGAEVEEARLVAGLDFREPRYRREVFLRFYEFHLRYRAHPGAVYYALPWLVRGADDERALWAAFLNGNTQNIVTTSLVLERFPDVRALDERTLEAWVTTNYARLAFDTDRRYFKKRFVESVACYRKLLGGRTQAAAFGVHLGADPRENFRALWAWVSKAFVYFGRLSTFSYLEYLRIVGLPVECDSLFLDDLPGSKSHRNGLAKVLGRDDLDWHDSNPAGFAGDYGADGFAWLEREGATLLAEARARAAGKPYAEDVGYFTLESALCTYKSWHRLNRRYPNVYNDLFHDRIRVAEAAWGRRLETFWEARRAHLPVHLRLEDNPADCGVKPLKQNHYLRTGEVIMMDREWACFRNAFNEDVRRRQAARGAA